MGPSPLVTAPLAPVETWGCTKTGGCAGVVVVAVVPLFVVVLGGVTVMIVVMVMHVAVAT